MRRTRPPRTKYQEYDRFWAHKSIGFSASAGTAFGKYISKLDTVTNLYTIDDLESKTTYKLGLGERRAFGDAHRNSGISILEWYESLAKAAQERIIKVPFR